MANPQAENGHVDIANEIIEKLCHFRIPGEEMQVLFVVWRKTYGWHKREDQISLSQFSSMTGMKRPNIVRAIKSLVSKAILSVIKSDTTQSNLYRFNKDFDEWKTLSKVIPHVSKAITGVIKSDNKAVSELIHTKEIKETITKEIIPVTDIVSYLNQKTGKNFSPKTKETARHIRARWYQFPNIESFKKVIDIKAEKWKSDPKMIDYLRPETLFGTKFESYLNESKAKTSFTIEPKPKCPKCGVENAKSLIWEDGCSICLRRK